MILWEDGDLFDSGLRYLAHGVNCRGVMNAGIAAQFRRRDPMMYEAYRRRCLKPGGMIPGDVMVWRSREGLVFNLATQRDPGPDARPWMITAAVGRMITKAREYLSVGVIGMPLIGCGIGGLARSQLEAALLPYQNAPVDLVVFSLRKES